MPLITPTGIAPSDASPVSISVPTTLAMQTGKRLPLLAMLGFGWALTSGAFTFEAKRANTMLREILAPGPKPARPAF